MAGNLLYRALETLAAWQRQIAVDEPAVAIREAYGLELPVRGALPAPCFLNVPEGLPQVSVGPNGMRIRNYLIGTRLLLAESNTPFGAEHALALDEAWQDEFAKNSKLGESGFTIKNLAGDDPWYEQAYDWNGTKYKSFGYLFELRIDDIVDVGVGATQ